MDVPDLFYFFRSGDGDGEVRGARKGGPVFIENPRRRVSKERGGGVGGSESAGNFGGGG